tara:strand:- start:377 stop:616 length:240 start_codon:yes stop_codon:yes gene_type:complete
MLLKLVNNVLLVTYVSFSSGVLFLTFSDVYRHYYKKIPIRNKSIKDNIVKMFNFGFYVGLGLSFSYIITGKPFIMNFIK